MARSLPGDSSGRDLSGRGKKPTQQGALTLWRRQRAGLVRTERIRPSNAHSLSGDDRGRDLSGHKKKQTEQGTPTSWRRQKEGLVRTWKETERARHTDQLEAAEGGACQYIERNQLSEVYSPTEDGRERACQDKERNRQSKAGSLSGDGRERGLS